MWYYVAADENHSNSTPAKVGPITIAQLEATLNWTNTSFASDGNSHVPTATVSNLVGSDACTVTVDGAQTDAGTYTATATALSNSNYKLPATATQSFTISGAGITYNDGSTVTTPKFGETLKAVLTPTKAGLSYQWYRGTDAITPNGDSETYTLVEADIGKAIHVVITDSNSVEFTSAATATVEKAENTTAAPGSSSITATTTNTAITVTAPHG